MAIIPDFPDHLKDMHHNWHQPGSHPGGGPGRLIPAGQPGSGLEFLTFHRDFVNQFHAWYDSQPFADQSLVGPWPAIPAELKVPATTNWNQNLAGQETRIQTNSPPFPSADELGQFIENGIHNWIHPATAIVFNEPVVATFHSPTSTYFYNIHGLVDLWWTQWHPSKLVVKEIIDSKGLKEFAPEHKLPIEGKARAKEIKEFKEKDKDLIEGGHDINVGDPGVIIGQLAEHIRALEGQLSTGRAFIQPAERPAVGPQHEHQ